MTSRLTLGLVVWIAALGGARPDGIMAVLYLAPLVLVPTMLALVEGNARGPMGSLVQLAFPAAVPLAVTAVLPTGPVAATLTVPWLALTAAPALVGLSRFVARRDLRPGPPLGRDAALGFLAIGALVLTLVRLAIHYHVAGFVLLGTVVLLAGRAPGDDLISRLALAMLIVGIPITALGFLGMPGGSLIGGLAVAAGGALAALGHLRLARVTVDTLARGLFLVAGASISLAMVLAAGWAITFSFGIGWIELPLMAAIHGSLNAFGFALAGTIGWARLKRLEESP